jgi:hypothetical protein
MVHNPSANLTACKLRSPVAPALYAQVADNFQR